MVYASSSTALKDGLGSSKFITDYNISDKSECSLEEYKKSTVVMDKEEEGGVAVSRHGVVWWIPFVLECPR